MAEGTWYVERSVALVQWTRRKHQRARPHFPEVQLIRKVPFYPKGIARPATKWSKFRTVPCSAVTKVRATKCGAAPPIFMRPPTSYEESLAILTANYRSAWGEWAAQDMRTDPRLLAKALRPDAHLLVRRAAAGNMSSPIEAISAALIGDSDTQVRVLAAAHPNASAVALEIAIRRDRRSSVICAALRHKKTPADAVEYAIRNASGDIRRVAMRAPNCPELKPYWRPEGFWKGVLGKSIDLRAANSRRATLALALEMGIGERQALGMINEWIAAGRLVVVAGCLERPAGNEPAMSPDDARQRLESPCPETGKPYRHTVRGTSTGRADAFVSDALGITVQAAHRLIDEWIADDLLETYTYEVKGKAQHGLRAGWRA